MVALMGRFVLLAAVLAGVAAASASGGAATYLSFRTPSGNIYCAYSSGLGQPTSLRCDIRSHLRPAPKPHRCVEGVYGESVGMSRTSRAAVLCISDTVVDPRARVLAYGTTWSRGGFRCVSRSTGLTCTNARGHGWFLSRESWRVY
jgi:hypothetical protein